MDEEILRESRAVLASETWAQSFRHRFGGFALLSGLGWLFDFATYSSVAMLHTSLFAANIGGAAAGMMTVFIGGRMSVFRDGRARLHMATGQYAAWSVFAILFASLLIDLVGKMLHAQAAEPLLAMGLRVVPWRVPVNLAISTIAKLIITPLTLILNFCAMMFIHGYRRPPQPARRND